MKVFSLACLVVAFCQPAVSLRAQSNAPEADWSHRWLLVLQTSSSMQPRSDAMLLGVRQMLSTQMGGELHTGDSIGIWTFNDTLHSGEFPLAGWNGEDPADVMLRVMEFVHRQKFWRTANITNVIPALNGVIKRSGVITVILITDGEEPITGTPFDNAINTTYEKWRDEQKKKKMPFVTVLRGDHGVITGHTVTPLPWPVEFPALPVPPVVPAAKPAVKAGPPPAPRPNIILSGRKPPPEPAAPQTQTNVAPVVTNAPAGVVSTNNPEPSPQPQAVAPPAAAPSNALANVVLPAHVASAANPPPEQSAVVPANPDMAIKMPVHSEAATMPSRTVETQVAENAPPSGSTGTNGALSPLEPPVSTPPPVVTTIPIASARNSSFWLMGLVVVSLGTVVALLLYWRSRSSPPASLITRSLDQGKPPR